MAASRRFTIFAAIAPLAGWRRALALDRGAGAARAVVLSFVPEEVAADATRFAAVVRDAEAAAKLKLRGAVPVLGLETVGETLAVVEPYRPGASLRALLASGGRLPPDVAGRIVADACAVIVHAHSLERGDGLSLVHGALDPGRISIGRDGSVAVSGFGMAGFASVADDVRALGAILHESLAGEPPSDPTRAPDGPGIRPPLAAAVGRAIGASPGEPFATAEELAKAIQEAVPLAARAAVASYAEAVLPRGEGKRAELFATLEGVRAPSREEAEMVSEDLIVGTAITPVPQSWLGAVVTASSMPPPRPPPLAGAASDAHAVQPPPVFPEPLAPSRPAPDAATTFPAPRPLAERRWLAIVAVAAVCAVAGFALGFVGSRFAPGAFAAAPPPAVPTSVRTDDLPLPAALKQAPPKASRATAPVRKPTKAVRQASGSQKAEAAMDAGPASESAEEAPAAAESAPEAETPEPAAQNQGP